MNNLLFKVLRQILLNQSILFDTLVDTLGSQVGVVRVATVNLIREIDDSTGENDTKKSKVDWKAGDIAEIKQGWDRAGFRFDVLGPAVFLLQWWVPIEDPEDDDPDEPTYHKESALMKVDKR